MLPTELRDETRRSPSGDTSKRGPVGPNRRINRKGPLPVTIADQPRPDAINPIGWASWRTGHLTTDEPGPHGYGR